MKLGKSVYRTINTNSSQMRDEMFDNIKDFGVKISEVWMIRHNINDLFQRLNLITQYGFRRYTS